MDYKWQDKVLLTKGFKKDENIHKHANPLHWDQGAMPTETI